MNVKRHLTLAAIFGIAGLGFGLAIAVIGWLAASDEAFSWFYPKFVGLFGAVAGPFVPYMQDQKD